jgi:nitroimidazol reductase NimA-like FMN-containing flavoprotein (pyridoxamine 5'-phosphate oxidase superfamily)
LTARVATNGPTVRPTWYLWEDQAFWILSGPWAKLLARVRTDPALAVVIDVCDTATGLMRQVIAHGDARILPFDGPRGYRKLSRYLGPDEERWNPRFRSYLHDAPDQRGTVWIHLQPTRLTTTDLSYAP